VVPTQYFVAPSAGRHPSAVSILVVEDNPADVRLLQEALKDLRLAHSLDVVSDGQAPLDFLFRHGKYETARRPDLVLLDLNLPGKDGSEVLAIVKERVETRRIPVVVFTSSSAQVDIQKAYDLHANGYVTKPSELKEFCVTIYSLCTFWLETAELPPRTDFYRSGPIFT